MFLPLSLGPVQELNLCNKSVARIANDDDDVRTTRMRSEAGRVTTSPLPDDRVTTTSSGQDDDRTTTLGQDDVGTTMGRLDDDVLTTARKPQDDVGTTMHVLALNDDLTTRELCQKRGRLAFPKYLRHPALLQEGLLREVDSFTFVSTAECE